MTTIEEKRRQRLEQAIRDMGNYGVKLRKPEELPDFDQPVDYEEEKKRFEPVQLEELEEVENHEDFSQTSCQETGLSSTGGAVSVEETHRRVGKAKCRERLAEFQGKYLQPFRISQRKAVYVSGETQRRLNRVIALTECSNTAGLINLFLYTGKVCLCDTNLQLYHKAPSPNGEGSK